MARETFTRGDILRGSIRNPEAAKHPIIFWENLDGSDDFIGLMITSKPQYRGVENIPMNEEHFEANRRIGYNNSHLVKAKFFKHYSWRPFTLRGRLTQEGIDFAEEIVSDCITVDFMQYKYHIDNP